ncbi:MAG: cell division protein FtsZ [Candidatus Nanoarchaeia archaeon]|jgi:cell division protein FtsZ
MDFIIESALKGYSGMNIEDGIKGQARIKVIGAGGGGTNAVSWLYQKGIQGAEIIGVNTDEQHLRMINADHKILLGKELTRGLGAGGNPEQGAAAAEESKTELKEVLKDTDMLFLLAGMGGGTGTGSAPVIAQMAKDMGTIVIGCVTMPFSIEKARVDKAEIGLSKLRQSCNSVIVIDNNRLVKLAGNLPVSQAFAVANELVSTMIKSIVETIALPSLVNLDFADVKAIMTHGNVCSMGVGESSSDNRVEEAVKKAMQNPLLEVDYNGATGALIHITGGEDMTLQDVNRIGELISEKLDQNAMVMWGSRIQSDMEGKIRVMLIATGVKSPWIIGPERIENINQVRSTQAYNQFNEELGINILR